MTLRMRMRMRMTVTSDSIWNVVAWICGRSKTMDNWWMKEVTSSSLRKSWSAVEINPELGSKFQEDKKKRRKLNVKKCNYVNELDTECVQVDRRQNSPPWLIIRMCEINHILPYSVSVTCAYLISSHNFVSLYNFALYLISSSVKPCGPLSLTSCKQIVIVKTIEKTCLSCQIRAGQVRSGQVRSGQVWLGESKPSTLLYCDTVTHLFTYAHIERKNSRPLRWSVRNGRTAPTQIRSCQGNIRDINNE